VIRFASIQFRTQALVAAAGVAVLAVVLGVTGPHLVHVYDATVADCQAHGDCSLAGSGFLRTYRGLQIGLDVLVVVVPGLLGIFWGAPLVARELETGTYRLAWTQSVTRVRWLGVKLALVGTASMVVAGVLSLLVTWWSSPIDRVNQDVFTSFDQRALVSVGFALFAFAFGVAVGMAVRRTVVAMVVVLVSFVTIRLLVNHFVLPHLIAPDVRQFGLAMGTTVLGYGSMNGSAFNLIAGAPNLSNAWIYSSSIVNSAGRALTPQTLAKLCPQLSPTTGIPAGGQSVHIAVKGAGPAPPGSASALNQCITTVNATYHDVVTYQPGSHYWPLQWLELGMYVGAAIALGLLCLWWIRRRIS
jgi:ABC-type transport system involved in multi-copper enzyme maturation permease subunit